jgi:tetratricopeptide (TPR) repeat protein
MQHVLVTSGMFFRVGGYIQPASIRLKAREGTQMATWRILRFGVLAVAALAMGSTLQAAEAPPELQEMFSRANQLIEQKNYAEALPLLRDLALKAPDASGVFNNLGLVALRLGDRELQAQSLQRYLELRPDEPQSMTRLMRAYQALGKVKERDAQRERIFTVWKALPAAEKEKTRDYLRDEFDVGEVHIMVIEIFEPAAPMNILYRFEAEDASRKPLYVFTLETGDSDTKFARERGTLRNDERIYSLDRYENNGQVSRHSTFGLMSKRPDYDAVRAMVVDAVEGRLRPVTSSTRPIPQQP